MAGGNFDFVFESALAGSLVKILSFLISFLFVTSMSQAADPVFRVSSFYQASGYLTERFIPFAVHRPGGGDVDEVVRVEVNQPCYSMVDPHRAHIFHIYCSEATEAEFKVVIKDNGVAYNIPLPAISIKKLALISSTPKPVTPGPGVDPLAKGRKLFQNNCARCHSGQYPLPATVTPAKITKAFNDYSQMDSFRGFFTTQELSDLSKFMNEGL